MLNFYRHFLPYRISTRASLNIFLVGSKRKDRHPVQWTAKSREMLCKQINDIVSTKHLQYHKAFKPLFMHIDAFKTSLGAVLQQNDPESLKPLAYFSKQLSPSQTRYRSYDHGLLGILK